MRLQGVSCMVGGVHDRGGCMPGDMYGREHAWQGEHTCRRDGHCSNVLLIFLFVKLNLTNLTYRPSLHY